MRQTGTRSKWLAMIPPAIGLAFFLLAILVLHRELRHFHYRQITAYIHQLPATRLLLSLLLTMFSYLLLVINEALYFRHVHLRLPFGKIALASFISSALSHNIGYSILSGGSLRFRFYSAWEATTLEISTVIGTGALFFWLGFLLLGGTVFCLQPLALPPSLHLPLKTILPLGLFFLALVALYLLASARHFRFTVRGWQFHLPPAPWSLLMLGISAADWFLAGASLYLLLPPELGLPLPRFLGIYLLAQITGVGSQVPGGLGVFESVFLLLLGQGLHSPSLLGALLAYRGIYYLLPLIIGALLLGLHEAFPRLDKIKRFSGLFGRWLSTLAPTVFSLLVLLAGAILLFSGATPAIGTRLNWVNNFLPLPLMEISHFLGSLVGTGLIFLGIGLQRRQDSAYRLSLALLTAGIVLSLIKGFDYEEAIILLLMLLALLPNRRYFYRRGALTSQPFTFTWVAAILIILSCSLWLTIFSSKHVFYSHELWWQFTLSGDVPRMMRALVGAMIFAMVFALRRLLHPPRPVPAVPLPAELERALPIIRNSPETVAYLALLEDKNLLFSDSGNSFIMYGTEGRSWVAMGDPIGRGEDKSELAWKFREMSDRHAGWTVFYEVGRKDLHIYVDLGLTLLKLGEEARVPLKQVALEGKANKWFRYITHHLEEEGYRMEVVPAESVTPLLPQLRVLSDQWLKKKNTREKGFSLGFFKESYLLQFPLALVRRENRIVAFANIWPGAGQQELSVDLMRFSDEAPDGAMDYLFIQLMLWGQAHGYHWFNLGMAPFSGFETHPLAPLWNKLGSFLYQHGEQFYNFRGIRQYKEKFRPVWESRYLAAPVGMSLPRILANISTLVSRGLKGVISK